MHGSTLARATRALLASAAFAVAIVAAGAGHGQSLPSGGGAVGTGDWYWRDRGGGSGPTPLAPSGSAGTVTAVPLPPDTSRSALTPVPMPTPGASRALPMESDYERGYRQGRLDAIRELDMGVVRSPAPPAASPYAAGFPPPVVTTSAEPDWVATDWARIQANWPSMRYEIQRRWPQLTAYDLDQIGGSRNELLARIQARYGISNQRADEQVAAWQRSRS